MDKQLEILSKKHGAENVHAITLSLDGEEVTFYILDPKKVERPYSLYSRIITFYQKDQLLEVGSTVIAECWLGGDDRVKDRDNMLHITAAVEVRKLVGFLPIQSSTTLAKLVGETSPSKTAAK